MGKLEYQINGSITLKLENNKTNIYVNGKLFNQCKYLLLNLSPKDFNKFDEIESIDEAFKIYHKIDRKHEKDKTVLDPKEEFVGHCSNLQAWYENGYDLRILHSSLSFPLLRVLSIAGDLKAKMVLKELVTERILSKNVNTILYFLEEDYLFLFELEELEMLFNEIDFEEQIPLKTKNYKVNKQNIALKKINALIYRKRIANSLKEKKVIKINLEKRGWRRY